MTFFDKPPCWSTAIVATTINDGAFLTDYRTNLAVNGQLSRAGMIVICDHKTPRQFWDQVSEEQKAGLQIYAPSMEEQNELMEKLGFKQNFLLQNSDHRRNVGYLAALLTGAQTIISIDDDNLPLPDTNFCNEHAEALTAKMPHAFECASRFFNVMGLMEYSPDIMAYPRGYPYFKRHQPEVVGQVNDSSPVHLNAGLWQGNPDVDGMTWLVSPLKTGKMKNDSVKLAASTWSPVCSQNTAMRREVIAAYYFLRMGYHIEGGSIDRFGDIFQGYLVQSCVKSMGGAVRFGSPMVEHRRNSHNYMNDARMEMTCIQMTESLTQWLLARKIKASPSYPAAYIELSEELREAVEQFSSPIWTSSAKAYFHRETAAMIQWAKVCEKLI